jgi:hypothetical protein
MQKNTTKKTHTHTLAEQSINFRKSYQHEYPSLR